MTIPYFYVLKDEKRLSISTLEIIIDLKAKIVFLIFVRYYLFCLPFLAYNLTVIEDFYAIKIMLPKRNVILFISPSKVIVGIL